MWSARVVEIKFHAFQTAFKHPGNHCSILSKTTRETKHERVCEVRFVLIKQTATTLLLRHLVKGFFITALVYQRLELAIFDIEELAGLSKLNDVSGIEDHLQRSINIL